MLRCSFCIIPKVRPNLESRLPEHIETEVARLVESGYHEIVLTGIHLGHYGVEWNRGRAKADWVRLSHLLNRLAQIEGDFRLRISSIEATEVTRELIEEQDLILTMTSSHYNGVLSLAPSAFDKTYLLKGFPENGEFSEGVTDPIGLSLDVYNEVYLDIVTELERIMPQVLQMAKNKRQGGDH